MNRKVNKQVSFIDVMISKRESYLDKIDQIIDWKPIENELESIINRKKLGRSAYPVLTMFKIILLQSWNSLSYEQAEEVIADRMSFRRFIGIGLDEVVPDHTTIYRFREQLKNHILRLFDLINKQLSELNLHVNEGTLIDASLIQSAVKAPRKDDEPKDPDARWGGKGEDKMVFGYKAHVAMDMRSELIHNLNLSPANEHDSQHFEYLVSGLEEFVLADKGYAGASRSAWLKARDIGDGIMRKAARGRPLESWELDFNWHISKLRSGVERFFGTLKRSYRLTRFRYYSLSRNASNLIEICIGYNLKRALKLLGI